jgi:hypothetical protein
MSEVAEVWKHIDKHREQISGLEKDVFGISGRMTVLENSFQNHASMTASGQARIETKIECIQTALNDLNKNKYYEDGVKSASTEHKKTIFKIVGFVITLLAGGVIVIKFFPQ